MSNYLKFKNLHYGDVPLVLGNVWDVPSAKLMDSLGYEALGTSSAAIAAMLGYKDGEHLSFEELLFVVERIVKCVNVPLSVDMESGYGKSAKEIVENVLRLVRLGVVGINIEDSQVAGERKMLSAHQFQSILKEIKVELAKHDVDVFMNARTDTYLLNLPNKLEETLKRIALYEKAGIDAIFIPCLTSMEDTQMITQAATLPVNVMCMPDLPSFKELRQAGISRISSGNFVQEALMKSFRKILHQTLKDQSYKSIFN